MGASSHGHAIIIFFVEIARDMGREDERVGMTVYKCVDFVPIFLGRLWFVMGIVNFVSLNDFSRYQPFPNGFCFQGVSLWNK